MNAPSTPSDVLQRLEELPGIDDIVWSVLASLEPRFGAEDEPAPERPTRLAFVSPDAGAGTSLMALGTAIGLARHERVPVCLIETNLERPAVAGYLGLDPTGLSDVLDGRVDLDECLQESHEIPGLHVLSAGTRRALRPGEFTGEPLQSLLERIERRVRHVILDAPPLLDRLESRCLLPHADGAILVLRAGLTRRDAAEYVERVLRAARVPLLGSIFNAYHSRRPLLHGTVIERLSPRPDHAARREPHHASEDLDSNGAATASSPEAADGRVLELRPAAPARAPVDEDERERLHRREIDILQRRIAKLSRLLEQTEQSLRLLAKLKNVDTGIPSIYRGVQGLSSEEDALAFKQELMREIFQANLELKNAIARQS